MTECVEISKIIEADVVVIGGGPAGFGAAVAAGRKGLKVILLEKLNKIGGVLAVCPFMPFGAAYVKGSGIPIGGIMEEVAQRLLKMSPPAARIRKNLLPVFGDELHYDHEKLISTMYDMLEEANVRVLLSTTAISVKKTENLLVSVTAVEDETFVNIKGKVFIDCTGNGSIASKSGVPFKVGDDKGNVLATTLTFVMRDLNPSVFENLQDPCRWDIIKKGVEENKLDSSFKEAYIIQGYRDDIGLFNTINTGNIDGTNPDEVLNASSFGRKKAFELADYFINNVPGFEKGKVCYVGPTVGVRENRRFEGLYELTSADIFERRQFEDGVVICNNPVDEVWRNADTGLRHIAVDSGKGDYYNIPFRCLVPQKIKNLMFAGRLISADVNALASVRGMPTCMIMGQACGTASKMVVDRNIAVQDVNTVELVKDLDNQGVNKLLVN